MEGGVRETGRPHGEGPEPGESVSCPRRPRAGSGLWRMDRAPSPTYFRVAAYESYHNHCQVYQYRIPIDTYTLGLDISFTKHSIPNQKMNE